MTTQAVAHGGNRIFSLRFLAILCLGGAIGGVVSLALYAAKPVTVALLPAGLAMLLPTLVLKNFRLYWLVVFLFSTQFAIAKNLNDGLAIVTALHIDYTIDHFTFEITASDMSFMVLLLIWANDCLFLKKKFRFPPISWLALGYVGMAVMSTLRAGSPYLGFVELSWLLRYLLVYVYAVNCLDSKKAVRVFVFVGVLMLLTQGAMTIVRFYTGFMGEFNFGDTHQDLSQVEKYLTVDRLDPGSGLRAFGTLGSPGSTVRLCMMFIPFALFFCVPNPMFRMRLIFLAIVTVGVGGLILTFTRVFYITTALQFALVFMIMVRDRMLKREEVVLIVVLGLAALAAVSPKLYEQFTVREDSVSVRFLQYEATSNMIYDHPLIGVGLNNATAEKPKYVKTSFDKRDPNTQFYLEQTHNMYLNIASEIGIPGMLSFVAFFAYAGHLAWRQSRGSRDPEIRLIANAILVVFCSVAVNSMMDPLDEYPSVAAFFMLAGICSNLPRMEENGQEVREPVCSPYLARLGRISLSGRHQGEVFGTGRG